MNRDEAFLKHILDEIEFLNSNFKDMEFQDLEEDPVLQRACIRSLEIIGEAVKNLSKDFKEEHPDIE